ncbi:MAG: hypothetical protein ACTSQI_18460 [Candidatus Helarchaeota archaeon]
MATIRRLAKVISQDSTISYETLLEIHTTLHRYKEVLELRLSAYTFIDEVIPEIQTFSKMRELESLKWTMYRRFYRRIERLEGTITQVESILNQEGCVYHISKDLYLEIQKKLTRYYFVLSRWDFTR